jgi:threonine aldolase
MMRQAGVLAAAGRHALAHHVERLADDHANARLIAERLAEAVPGAVDLDAVETNIVYVDTGLRPAAEVVATLHDEGVLVGAMGEHLLRLVTHLDVGADACQRAADALVDALTQV